VPTFLTFQATLDLSMLTQSREHLRRNGMTYADHMRFAAFHGAACIWSGILLLIHAVIPGWLGGAGSRLVRRMKESFDRHGLEIADAND
jgi:hypothetical protein